MITTIRSFTGAYDFLSNFYVGLHVVVGEHRYKTAEHAFQAAKACYSSDRLLIQNCATACEAKRCGRNIELRQGWDGMKYFVMLSVLRSKFVLHSPCADKLIATCTAKLIKGNNRGDTVWGECRGEGANALGVLLMHVRRELQWQAHVQSDTNLLVGDMK